VRRLLITGAAGKIGSVLRSGLGDVAERVRLVDREPLSSEREGEEVMTLDLARFEAALEATAGVEAVVHLAAIPDEDRFERILNCNIVATYNLFEAARHHGARRVVFASTNHVTGMYPVDARVGPRDPPRPDTLYGVSKVFGESLGRLYADKHGLEVVCLRIGSFGERPSHRRDLHTWLSHRDAIQLFERSLLAAGIGFMIVYGVSANQRSLWENPDAKKLGFLPVDDAEQFHAELPDSNEHGPARLLQGGEYANPGYAGRSDE
jgi:uronate dehydrogenase